MEELTGKKRILAWAVLGILLILSAALLLLLGNHYEVQIFLEGSQEMTLEYGLEYNEPGASATGAGNLFYRSPTDLNVDILGKVDTSKIGDYTLEYRAAFKNAKACATRIVHVTDTQKPEIVLTATAGSFTLPGEAYQEEGYTATDDYDGDLTDQVIRKEENGIVTYQVTDSSGNSQSITREIFYDDPVPPEITLHDGSSITVALNKPFEDPGVTAVDNCDGDISDLVTVEGTVNTKKIGTYELTYRVSDSYANTAETIRKVTVSKPEPGLPPIPEHPEGGTVYLTFDDGPGPYTDELLDVLKRYHVKATFFLVNTDYIDKAERIAAEGHTVACHTATHRYSQVYASDEAYFADLYTIQNAIYERTGEKPMLLRFPGGSSNTVSRAYSKGIMSRLTKAVREQGFQYFDWNVDSFDAGGATQSNTVYRNVISGIAKHDTSVVLQHDIHKFSVEAVERIIQWGQANGYRFLPLSADSPGCHHGVNN